MQQKKLNETHNFLVNAQGLSVPEGNIVIFPNGIDELLFEFTMNGLLNGDDEAVKLYFFTQKPLEKDAQTLWLGNEEIRLDVIGYYRELAKKIDVMLTVVYESDSDFVSEESLGYEKNRIGQSWNTTA